MSYKHYIIMRTDLRSMTPGKIAAQASHAGTHLFDTIYRENRKSPRRFCAPISEWTGDRGFGTAIVLDGGDLEDWIEIYGIFNGRKGKDLSGDPHRFYQGIIVDPTYPLNDGAAVHLLKITTCVWFFCDFDILPPGHMIPYYMKDLDLL
jgi:hypothetical protein